MNQVSAGQTMANQQMWDRVSQFFSTQAAKSRATDRTTPMATTQKPVIQAQKITKDDTTEAFINTFQQIAVAAGWL